jgi:hypothetical protein
VARTTSDEVKAVLGGQWDGKTVLDPFIATASALVDWAVTAKPNQDTMLGDTLAAQVECYLAAHFYQHADQALKSKSTGGASGTFQGRDGMVLTGTDYGRTACALDVTGQLARRSKEVEEGGRRRAVAFHLGGDSCR